jgi:hypothetical protein
VGNRNYYYIFGGDTMKKLTQAVWSFFHSMGQAKAAAHFARMGDYKSAQAVYKN